MIYEKILDKTRTNVVLLNYAYIDAYRKIAKYLDLKEPDISVSDEKIFLSKEATELENRLFHFFGSEINNPIQLKKLLNDAMLFYNNYPNISSEKEPLKNHLKRCEYYLIGMWYAYLFSNLFDRFFRTYNYGKNIPIRMSYMTEELICLLEELTQSDNHSENFEYKIGKRYGWFFKREYLDEEYKMCGKFLIKTYGKDAGKRLELLKQKIRNEEENIISDIIFFNNFYKIQVIKSHVVWNRYLKELSKLWNISDYRDILYLLPSEISEEIDLKELPNKIQERKNKNYVINFINGKIEIY